MLLALSASCVFPLQLHASLPWTYNRLSSLMSASHLSLRPPAVTSDGWFPLLQAVSSADLCNAFSEHHDRAFLLEACWRRWLWACVQLPSLWRGLGTITLLHVHFENRHSYQNQCKSNGSKFKKKKKDALTCPAVSTTCRLKSWPPTLKFFWNAEKTRWEGK